jgi:hypothetical protein
MSNGFVKNSINPKKILIYAWYKVLLPVKRQNFTTQTEKWICRCRPKE